MSFIKHRTRSASAESSGTFSCSEFAGINGAESSGSESPARAAGKSYYNKTEQPGAVNMLRRPSGEICKRPGFKEVKLYDEVYTVGSVFYYKESDRSELYCYMDDNLMHMIYPSLSVKNAVFLERDGYEDSYGIQAGKYLLLFNGYGMYIFDMEKEGGVYFSRMDVSSVISPELTYLPTTFIGGYADGSASAYQQANILNPFVAEQYIGDGSSREYKVHFPLDFVYKAYIKDAKGQWAETEVESTTEDTVTFRQAPPEADITGEDNVRIVYRRPLSALDYSRVCYSRCATVFGVSGFADRVFVSGSDYDPGYIYYSEINEPTYFPENNYIRVGNDATSVRALIGNGVTLYAICNDKIYCIEGSAVADDENTDYVENAVFSIVDRLTTPPAIAHEAVIFDGEINYLTKEGVCAITPSGVLDERCCQIRSSHLNGFLKKENLTNCKMIAFGNYLVITNKNDRLYILDGNNFGVSENAPFSTRQYEGYIFTGINAQNIWEQSGKLFFTDGTKVYCFENNFLAEGDDYCDHKYDESGNIYTVPVEAYWETPALYCGRAELNKFFVRVCAVLGDTLESDGTNMNTDVKISVKLDSKQWKTVKDYDGSRRSFRYGSVDYGRFTYRGEPKSSSLYSRSLHKKGRALKLRFENGKGGEPFILKGYRLEYLQM